MTDAELIQALTGIEDGLTEWEVGFVESISKQKYPLTPKQRAKAEKILEDLDSRPAAKEETPF